MEQAGSMFMGIAEDLTNEGEYIDYGVTAWDGRNELGQIVSPGTYLVHIEAYNFFTGKTFKDIAPIVVGVSP